MKFICAVSVSALVAIMLFYSASRLNVETNKVSFLVGWFSCICFFGVLSYFKNQTK